MRRLLPILLLACFLIPVAATDETELTPIDLNIFPSYALLNETDMPPLDRIDMARRFRGLTVIPEVLPRDTIRQIGETETFNITPNSGPGITPISTHLLAIGEHVYIWVEDGLAYDAASLNDLANRFDIQVYEFVRNLWGNEPSPGIDGEIRLHIVITSKLDEQTGGTFSVSNSYPRSVVPSSNEYDMMVMSYRMFNSDFADVGISGAAHEFHHMIQHGKDVNESNWLREGLAPLTEYLLGIAQPKFLLDAYVDAPQTPLRSWGLGNNRPAEYGAPLLFMIYLYDRFGLEAIQTIDADPDNDLQSINNMLLARGEASVDVVFADWVLANLLRDNTGNYSYQSLVELPPMRLRAQVLNLPSTFTFGLDQYSTHYYHYQNLPDSLNISFQMNDAVPMIPTNPTSGQMMWYSQRADNSNPRLTRAFDLRNVSEAQLDFKIWYDLEHDWDYTYLSISTDGGQTWEIQSTNVTVNTDSNGRAYGVGYTGQSNSWLADTLSLNDYVGQEILLRFELVTDDAINLSGFAIDDIRLDAIGYAADFEADNGGWVSEGWIHTDNRLPQRAWVQIIEHTSAENIIHRYLADGNEAWQLNLHPDTQNIHMVVSPFAPLTSLPATYTLQVD